MTNSLPLLRNVAPVVRSMAAIVMICLAIGYIHAVAYVFETTHMAPHGIQERYRGNSPGADKNMTEDIHIEKSYAEMLNIIHTHILTMTIIFSMSGLITLMTSVTSPSLKKFIILEPFYGILATFFGLWMTRYVHSAFSWITMASGIMMALAFFVQCFLVVRELRMNHE